MSMVDELSPEVRQRVAEAIRLVRAGIRWKPDKDLSHLRTRIDYGHLPVTATMSDYEQIISDRMNDKSALVYAYVWRQDVYPTVVSVDQGRRWLVMFGLNGTMETAFPPDDPDQYLADKRFYRLGTMQELSE
jgi:hypothetical protein